MSMDSNKTTKHWSRCLLALAIAASGFASAAANETAQLFSPGVISGAGSNFAPTFSPSSSFVLFSRKSADGISILLSKRDGSAWLNPVVAPFSGRWTDLETAMSVDASYIVFASDRPIPGTEQPLRIGAGPNPSGGNLWRIKIMGEKWGEPEWLPASINKSPSTWTPSIAGNGNLYFMSPDERTRRFRLRLAPMSRGSYQPTRQLAFSTGEFNDVDPMIDPKERFLIFSSDRAQPGTADAPGPERLYIAFSPRSPAPIVCPIKIPGWEDPSLSQIEARLGDAGTTLYFASNHPAHAPNGVPAGAWDDGKAKIWMVPFKSNVSAAEYRSRGDCTRKDT